MKILKFIYHIFVGFIILVAFLLLISILPITGNFKILTVVSGSMEPTIKTGAVVVVKPASDYKIGDIITFGPNTKTKPPVTHRINDMEVVGGNVIYITKGDANNAPDIKKIQKKDIIGKVLFSIPYFGYLVNFIKNPVGFIMIIIVPTAIIIYDEIRKIWREIMKLKTKKKDKEQDQEIARLKEELEKLKQNQKK